MSDTAISYVPTAAFISHFVLSEAKNSDRSLSDVTNSVARKFGVTTNGPYPPKEVELLGWLYCLLVFPSEVWKRDGLLEVVVEKAKQDQELLPANASVMSKDGIRSMRNAVSHARVAIQGDHVTFSDQRPNATSPHFEHRTSFKEVMNFLLVLGRAFHECQQISDQIKQSGKAKP